MRAGKMFATLLLAQVFALLLVCSALAAPPATNTNLNLENDVLHFSYELERWLDADKRPCHDFYGYVCGRALNSTKEQLDEQQQRDQQRFEKFLTSDNDEQLLDAELKLKQFYSSCKNARTLEDLKSSLMYRLSGGWPAIDNAAAMLRRRRSMSWMDVLSAFHDAGVNYIFTQHVEMKSNKRVVYLQPDDATRYTLRKFEQLVGDVMQEYAVEADRARLIALEIMSFERSRREIAKMEVSEEDKEFSYADFKASSFGTTLQLDWDAYFKSTLGKPLKPSDTVVVHKMPKLVKLFEFLQQTTMTRLLNWIWIDYLMDKNIANCQKLVKQYFEPVYQHIVEHAFIDKVQLAQLYSEIARTYDDALPPTSWIDEMSQQSSHLFQGRVMHLTLNGNANLDAMYAKLQITNRNFYRNLEKLQRFLVQQGKTQHVNTRVGTAAVEDTTQLANDFMSVFLGVGALMQQQNLSVPLHYVLVGERFAERMIASGSSSPTPGAWRSMESERDFGTLRQCVGAQQTPSNAELPYNLNSLLEKLLAQHLALQTYEQWQQKNAALQRRLDGLLGAGRLQLSMGKLYFIGALLTECQQYESATQKALVHSYLRNSPKFRQTFKCRANDPLYARSACKVV